MPDISDELQQTVAIVVPPSRRGKQTSTLAPGLQVTNFSTTSWEVTARPLGLHAETRRVIVEAAQRNPELAAVAANPAAVEALAGAVQGALAVSGAVTASTVAEFADSEAAKILDDAVDKAVRDTPQLDALPPEAKRHAKQDLLVVLESNFVKGDQRLPLLTEIPAEQRDAAAAVLAMRSSEAVGRGLIRASWVLVGATAALVIATAVLGYITASPPANNTHVTVVVPAASPSK